MKEIRFFKVLVALFLVGPGCNAFTMPLIRPGKFARLQLRSSYLDTLSTNRSESGSLIEAKIESVGTPLESASPTLAAPAPVPVHKSVPTSITTEMEEKALAPRDPGMFYLWEKSNLKLNLFGAYYGFVAISLGLWWYAALQVNRVLYKIFKKYDPNRKVPVMLNGIWGWIVLRFSRNYPIITGADKVNETLKSMDKDAGVMYVANHCSWMDIPFVAMAIGRRNYKIVAKKELLRVPILGAAIAQARNVVVDRTSRKSQVETYKNGVAWLKKGVNLCAFPEGTRSKSGRLMGFKRGAFKMAQAAGSPIVPISISYSNVLNPTDWVFPVRSARSIPCRVHVHEPINIQDMEEEDIIKAVTDTLSSALPPSQQPQPKTS